MLFTCTSEVSLHIHMLQFELLIFSRMHFGKTFHCQRGRKVAIHGRTELFYQGPPFCLDRPIYTFRNFWQHVIFIKSSNIISSKKFLIVCYRILIWTMLFSSNTSLIQKKVWKYFLEITKCQIHSFENTRYFAH